MFKRNTQKTEETLKLIVAIAEHVMIDRGLEPNVDTEITLAEEGLGLDSMAILELLQKIEDDLEVDIPEAYWGSKRFKNLRDIANVVAKQRK